MPFGLPELARAGLLPDDLDTMLYSGGQPVIYDRSVPPEDYFPSYIQTYIERDVRNIKSRKHGDVLGWRSIEALPHTQPAAIRTDTLFTTP